jgi:hypothetical protein
MRYVGAHTPQAAEAAVIALTASPGELKTETVEEFISISDGQVSRHMPSDGVLLLPLMLMLYAVKQCLSAWWRTSSRMTTRLCTLS